MDMQLYLISPLIIFPLHKYGYRFMPVMVILGLASGASIFSQVLINRNSFWDRTGTDWYTNVYYPTHHHVGAWLIGIALGYILFASKNSHTRVKKVKTFSYGV